MLNFQKRERERESEKMFSGGDPPKFGPKGKKTAGTAGSGGLFGMPAPGSLGGFYFPDPPTAGQ